MIVFLSILLIALVLFLIITRVLYSFVFRSPSFFFNHTKSVADESQYDEYKERTKDLIKVLKEKPYEEAETVSKDGLRLWGRYYRGKEGKPTAILFHGYRGDAYRDFSGGSQLLFSLGWNILLIDERAHGKSGGHTITFGVKEKEDIENWVEFIKKRSGEDTPIYLFGISMGGAAVLMASGLGIKGNIRGIVADCPYSSPLAIISKVMRENKIKPEIMLPLVRAAARVWGGFSLVSESAEDAVKKAVSPILIIHGLDDRFVPDSMSREIYEANKKSIEYQTFEGAGHGLSYMLDTPRYESIVKDFIKRTL